MAGKDKDHTKDSKVAAGSNIPHESIRAYGESVGIANLPDEATSFLSEQVTYCLKIVLQVCNHSIIQICVAFIDPSVY
ncbi:hypothetical protein V1264_010042 [Littorina saxatilis]|uniref:Histone H4 n=1 Tax=Littorina saxatilis TaxID=31220 RepID=A0AAN9FZS4_9CAEN